MAIESLEKFRIEGEVAPLVAPIQPKSEKLRIIAFDQSLSDTGWALIQGNEILEVGNIRPKTELTGHAGNLEKAEILHYEACCLFDRLNGYAYPKLVIELPPVGNRMMRPESSLLAALAVRLAYPIIDGCVMVGAQKAKKRITGTANATKKMVREGVLALNPAVSELPIKNEAIYDALALAWTASEEI